MWTGPATDSCPLPVEEGLPGMVAFERDKEHRLLPTDDDLYRNNVYSFPKY